MYSDTTLPRAEGSTAAYTCNTGYNLSDNTVRMCTASGWSDSDPICTGK